MPHIVALVDPKTEKTHFLAYRGPVATEKEAHRYKAHRNAHDSAQEFLGIARGRNHSAERREQHEQRVRFKGWRYYVREVKE